MILVSLIWATAGLLAFAGYLYLLHRQEHPLATRLKDMEATLAGMALRNGAVETDLAKCLKAINQQPQKPKVY